MTDEANLKAPDAKDFVKAEKSARYLLQLLDGLGVILPVLGDAATFAKATRLLEGQVETLRKEEADTRERLATTRAEGKRATDEALAAVDRARAEAEQIVEVAKAVRAESERVLAEAKDEAAGIVARGNHDAEAAVAAVQDELARVRSATDVARGELQGVQAQIAEARSVHAGVLEDLAAVKRKISG